MLNADDNSNQELAVFQSCLRISGLLLLLLISLCFCFQRRDGGMIGTSTPFVQLPSRKKTATVGHSSASHIVKENVFCATCVTNMFGVNILSCDHNIYTNLGINSPLQLVYLT